MRGFVQGVMWGGLAAVGGLVVLSQVAGPVTPRSDAIALTPPPTEIPAPETPAPEPAPPEPVAPTTAQPVIIPEAESEAPATVATPAPTTTAVPADPPPALPLPPPPASNSAATLEQPPSPPSSDPPSDALASAGRIDPVIPPVVRPSPVAAMPPASLGLPTTELAPRDPDQPPPPPAPAPPPAPPAPPEPVPQTAPAPTPEPAPRDEGSDNVAGATGPASGVVTGRLPRIGVDDASAPDSLDATPQAELAPRSRFARPFENAAQLPLFAIVLIDSGAADVDRTELAALDLPLSIVIDPLSDGAAERAALWRAGGQEVLMAASGIPVGASPSDLEQSLQVLSTGLPEAVALIDSDGAAFQNNSPLASQMVSILADQGRGLVTLDQGLNAAAREARRAALPATTVFRRLDAAEEAAPVILRYLDRAAFQAAQSGQVAVIGSLRPQTIDGILAWVGEGRASNVALAPITALLQP